MRTVHNSSRLLGGCLVPGEGCLVPGGVPGPGRDAWSREECLVPGGVPGPGGAWSGGTWSWGVPGPGGVWYPSMH